MNAPESGLARDLSRRDVLRLGATGVGAVALGFGLAGCSSSDKPSPSSAGSAPKFTGGPPAGGTPVKGGTLTVGMITQGEAETINVLTSINNPDIARVFNLYDAMFTQLAGGKAGPGLVEEATPNADATVWNFRIRSDVVWHDGKPLTPEDIVYTIQHSWGDPTNIFNIPLKGMVDFAGVKKVGPRDVRVPLLHGIAQFPTITLFNSLVVVQDGTKNFSNGNGTGPFKLVSFTPGKQSTFSANTSYWRNGEPYVDTLVIDSSFSSESARMNALLAGQIQIIPNVSPTLARANASSGRIAIGNQPGPGFVDMNMRVDKGPLADERVRQALKLIPDRQSFVDTIFGGYATIGNDLGGYTDQFFADDLKPVQDIPKAKALLKAAGAEGLQVTLDTSAAAYGMNEAAALYAEQAKAAGVDIKINQTDPASYFTPAAGFFERPFSMSFYNTGVNSLAMFYLLTSVTGGAYNESHFGSPADDALLYSALGEVDEAKAAQKWHAVQEQQVKTSGYLIPQNMTWLDAYGPKVGGIQTTPAMNCDNFNFASAWLNV